MQISTLSGIKNKTNETYGDEDIKQHNIESAEIMKLKTELFKAKQNKNTSEINTNSGLSYMLGLHNQTEKKGGLSYMLGLQNKQNRQGGLSYMLGKQKTKLSNANDKIRFMLGGQTNKVNNILGDKMSKNKSSLFSTNTTINKSKSNMSVQHIIGMGVNKIKKTNVPKINYNQYFKMSGTINDAKDKIRNFTRLNNKTNIQNKIMQHTTISYDSTSKNGMINKISNFVKGRGYTENNIDLQTYGEKTPIKNKKVASDISYSIEQNVPEDIVYSKTNINMKQNDDKYEQLEKQNKIHNIMTNKEMNELKLEKARMEVQRQRRELGMVRQKQPVGAVAGAFNTLGQVANNVPMTNQYEGKIKTVMGMGLGIDDSIRKIKQVSNIGGSGLGFYTMASVPGSQGTGYLEMMPGQKSSKINEILGFGNSNENITEEPEYIKRVKQIRQLSIPKQPIPVYIPQQPVQEQPVQQQYRTPTPVNVIHKTPPPGKMIGAGGKVVTYTRGSYQKHQ